MDEVQKKYHEHRSIVLGITPLESEVSTVELSTLSTTNGTNTYRRGTLEFPAFAIRDMQYELQ